MLVSSFFGDTLRDSLQTVMHCNSRAAVKTNTPIGVGPNHIVTLPLSIKYGLTFTNTSSDTIQSLALIDTLDHNLDLTSLEILNSSHLVNTIVLDSIIYFAFQDVYLPPGNKNKSENSVFVSYRLNTPDSLPPKTFIYNRCEVRLPDSTQYFTQRVFNSVKPDTGVIGIETLLSENNMLKVFPNPSTGQVQIVNGGTHVIGQVKVSDNKGSQIRLHEMTEQSIDLDLSNKPAGIYFIQFYGIKGELIATSKLVKF
jgi:hypothetical protein